MHAAAFAETHAPPRRAVTRCVAGSATTGAILSVDPWPDHVPVPSFGPRMVCTRCGIIGADARPKWQEQPARETLTGVQWR
jgi:hypothetical protein